jgi:hypothetical protein
MSLPRRIVGDHDVDRVQVKAWQHVQPSTTNHPFGLIPVFGIGRNKSAVRGKRKSQSEKSPCGCQRAGWIEEIRRISPNRRSRQILEKKAQAPRDPAPQAGLPSGDQSEVEPPGPIPNPEVKRPSANGSGTIGPVRVGRRQVNAPSMETWTGLFFCGGRA